MRRGYSMYTGGYQETPIDVGSTHVTIREKSGARRVATILEQQTDDKDRVTRIVLDRVIHDEHTKYEDWEATGCFATELIRKGLETNDERED